jgi:hypothetical protein
VHADITRKFSVLTRKSTNISVGETVGEAAREGEEEQ